MELWFTVLNASGLPWRPSVVFTGPGWRAIFKDQPGPGSGGVGRLPLAAATSQADQTQALDESPGLKVWDLAFRVHCWGTRALGGDC